jgi:Zinc-finger associated domain (zf-AD)
MTILELAGGGKVTVGDALKYINLEILVPFKSEEAEDEEEEENEERVEDEIKDHPEIPKSLCQECLDKLQSMYEFKYRCEENRDYLKNHVKELAEARVAAEKGTSLHQMLIVIFH